jgi:hypothetical protein
VKGEPILTTEFLHIVIDLSLRQIVAPDGQPIIICQVEANVPIWFWHEDANAEPGDKGLGKAYSLGRELDANNALYLDIKPFTVIIKRCADCMCFSVIAQNDVEESIYHIQRIEHGRVVSDEDPYCIIGKVSKGSRYEFDLIVGSPAETFRIETIPSEDVVLGKSKIIWQQTDEQKEGEN